MRQKVFKFLNSEKCLGAMMDENSLRLFVESGAVKSIHLIGKIGLLHVEAVTAT